MSDDVIRYEMRRSAAIVTLNRPERRNALNRELVGALGGAIERAASDPTARVMILTGTGSSFSAGMDLAELQTAVQAESQYSQVWDDAQCLGVVLEKLYSMPKPTIAAVNGAAVAGGAALVTVCDLAVATPDAMFSYPGVRRGLVAGLVMPHLLRQVGERLARYLLLTGEAINGDEACRAGLINATVPPGELMERALAWANAVAEGGPEALRSTKELLRQFSHQAQSVETTALAKAAPPLTEECRLGLHAFFSKQPAPWSSNGS